MALELPIPPEARQLVVVLGGKGRERHLDDISSRASTAGAIGVSMSTAPGELLPSPACGADGIAVVLYSEAGHRAPALVCSPKQALTPPDLTTRGERETHRT